LLFISQNISSVARKTSVNNIRKSLGINFYNYKNILLENNLFALIWKTTNADSVLVPNLSE